MSFLRSKNNRSRNNVRKAFSGIESLEDRQMMTATLTVVDENLTDFEIDRNGQCTAYVTTHATLAFTSSNDDIKIIANSVDY